MEFSVLVNQLPRETRLCCTLVGLTTAKTSRSEVLGWVGLRLFSHSGALASGTVLLGLWPEDEPKPCGTCASNVGTDTSTLVLLAISEYGGPVHFPMEDEGELNRLRWRGRALSNLARTSLDSTRLSAIKVATPSSSDSCLPEASPHDGRHPSVESVASLQSPPAAATRGLEDLPDESKTDDDPVASSAPSNATDEAAATAIGGHAVKPSGKRKRFSVAPSQSAAAVDVTSDHSPSSASNPTHVSTDAPTTDTTEHADTAQQGEPDQKIHVRSLPCGRHTGLLVMFNTMQSL